METKNNKSSKFAELFNYIQESQPQWMEWEREELENFISHRVEMAHNEYLSILSEKNDFQLADEIEQEVLYGGIKFSPVTYLNSFLFTEMDKDVDMKTALEYYKKTQHIFDKYNPDDDFIGSEKELLLIDELKEYFNLNKID